MGMAVTGGLRVRFIDKALHDSVEAILQANGWLTSSTQRDDVRVLGRPLEDQDVIKPTLVATELVPLAPSDAETGSNAEVQPFRVYISIFAQNRAIGVHIAHDLADGFRGFMGSVTGITDQVLRWYDYRVSPLGAPQGYLVLEEIAVEDPPPIRSQSFQEFLYTVTFTLTDDYYLGEF